MQEDRSQPRRATCKFKRKDEQMQKRKKLAVIGTLLIVLVAGGIVWQVVDVNRTGRSPVSALFKNEGQEVMQSWLFASLCRESASHLQRESSWMSRSYNCPLFGQLTGN